MVNMVFLIVVSARKKVGNENNVQITVIMKKNTFCWVLLLLAILLSACGKEETVRQTVERELREISFNLNSDGGIALSPTRNAISLSGMQWKLFCFDDEYRYLFEKTGTVEDSSGNLQVSVPKGQVFRFLFLFATDVEMFPALNTGDTYWDMAAYSPSLPLTDPMNLLISKGEADGTIRVAASVSTVAVTLVPRAVKVVIQKDESVNPELLVNTVTFQNAAISIPYAQIEPRCYDEYPELPDIQRSTYQQTLLADGTCYMLPDMCASSFGTNALLQVTDPVSGTYELPVSVPVGVALNAGAGKIYYIDITADEEGKLNATWVTHASPATLRLATQNLWGKSTSIVLDYFNQIDVDVLCAQECSSLSDAEIQAQGLYVHSHTNNGQGRCSIISRYPFTGVTPNGYGVYIDLGEGITALVMDCHGAYKPYGPYQLNGIDYGGYPATTDVDYVVKVNGEVRKEMVDKLLEDVASATTPFISISGDFNEPSWLDWTEEAVKAGLAPYVVQWPTTLALWEGGIKGDAYRTLHPNPVTDPGYTWTPFPSTQDTKDRLDMTLYMVSPNTSVKSCQIIGEDNATSDIVLPSWKFDHRGLRTEFVYTK